MKHGLLKIGLSLKAGRGWGSKAPKVVAGGPGRPDHGSEWSSRGTKDGSHILSI